MGPPLALGTALQEAGAIVVAAVASIAVLAPMARTRSAATLATLVLTPLLLIAEVWDTAQFRPFRDHPLISIVGAAVAIGLLGLGAAALRRRPDVLPILVVAVLPFRVPIASGGQTANLLVPLYLVIAAGALAFLVPGLRARGDARWEERRPPRIAVALMVFVGLYALQSLYTSDHTNAVNQLVFFYVPFALLFELLAGVVWTRRLVTRCLVVLTGVSVALACVGLIEWKTRTLLLNPRVIDANTFVSYFRVNSLFFDPNIYGRYLAMVMLGLAAALLWTRAQRVAIACAAALAVLWAGLVVTFSQSSFAALLLGLVVLAAVRWDPRRTLVVAGAAVVIAAVLVVAVGQHALHLDLASSKSANAATSGRLNLVKGGLRLWEDKPVLGWGSGGFAKDYRRKHSGSRERAASASHTIPVTVAAEQGIPGFVAYVAVLVLAFALLVRGARAGPWRAYLLAAFAALVLHTMLYAAFLEDPATWALLGAATALGDP
jgi:O-antigen ligase